MCEVLDPYLCQTDDDCVCSFEKQFKGNKEYADKCVEKAHEVTPSFCSKEEEGMARPGEGMICTNNVCGWDQKYECVDNDNDGGYANIECGRKSPGGMDCDDTNPNVNPDAEEICDGLDNDCNGETDETLVSPKGGCPPIWRLCRQGSGGLYERRLALRLLGRSGL